MFAGTVKEVADADFSKAKLRSLGVEAEDLARQLKGVSAELGYQQSEAELLGAAYDVASAGFTKAGDAAAVLKASALGATGGFSDLNTVANATTSVLNAYGKSASEAGRLVDQFIQTQNDGKIVIGEYAANIAKVAPVASALGIELAEINAVISQVTAGGTNAEVAFTGLKTALAQLASGNANKALAEINYEVTAADIASKGLVGVLGEMKDKGITVGQAFKAFGNEAAPVIQAVFNDIERTNELLDKQKNSAGAAAAAQAQAAATMKGAWTAVMNALKNLAVALLPAFAPLTKLLAGLAKVIGYLALNIKKVIQVLATIGTFVAVIKGAAVATKLWATATKILGTAGLKGVAAAQAAINALTGVGLPTIAAAAGAAALTYGALELAMKDAAGGQEEFNEQAGELDKILAGMDVAGKNLAEVLSKIGTQPDGASPGLDQIEDKLEGLALKAHNLTKELESVKAATEQSIGNRVAVAQAVFAAEQQILGVKKQQAEQQLKDADGQTAKIKAINDIYKLTRQLARVERDSAIAAAKAEQDKVEAQARYMAGLLTVQRIKLKEAEAAGKVTRAHRESVEAAQQGLDIANKNIVAQDKITAANIRSATAMYRGKIEAAGVSREMQIQAANQEATNARLAEGERRAAGMADQVERAAKSVWRCW